MGQVLRTTHIITREEVKQNSETHLYLFGDNTQRIGYGGQAKAMRDEPNAMGICTKYEPNNNKTSFFSDLYLIDAKLFILQDVYYVKDRYLSKKYSIVVIPELGTGLADLPNKAPLVYKFLLEQLDELEQFIKNN